MPPLVSVIIPTYDRPHKLRRALLSVDNQTYDDIEVIVIETPSSGSSNLTHLEDTIHYPLTHITTETDVGPSQARNIGMEKSAGEHIAFLDDDDEWLPEKTIRQVEQLEASSPEVGASMTGDVKVDSTGSVRGTYMPPNPIDPVRYQLSWNLGTFSMLMIRAEVRDKVGHLDEYLPRREDQDFLLRIVLEFDIEFVREPLVKKHTGAYQQLGNDYQAAVRANERFREKYADLAVKLGCREEMEVSFQYMLGRTAFENRDYLIAQRHFLRAIRLKPREKVYYYHFLAALGGPITHRIGKELSRRGLIP